MKFTTYRFKLPQLYFSMSIILTTLFVGAKDSIEWYYQNYTYLRNGMPSDVDPEAVEQIVNMTSGYNIFMSGIGLGNSGAYPIFLFLIIGFIFSCRFSKELNSGNAINEIVRIGYHKYHIHIALDNIINTFLFVFITLLIFLITCIVFFSPTLPKPGYGMEIYSATYLFYTIPFLYCVIQILNQAFFCSLISLISMASAYFTNYVIVSKIMPLTTYLFLTVISQLFYKFTHISFWSFLFPDMIFTPFKVYGNTGLGFVAEKLLSYLFFILFAVLSQLLLYKKFKTNYLK